MAASGEERAGHATPDPARPGVDDALPPIPFGPEGAATEALPQAGEGRVLAGRYRLLGTVGSGGMATVHRARDEVLQRDVAVKVLRPWLADQPDVEERFRREALQAAKLNHPHVVAVLDAGSEGDVDFLVMELVEGESLHALIQRDGPFPPAEAARLAAQLARGLAHAHSHGLVHRDVKPANVVLDARGARLTDFGIAKSVEEAAHLTGTGLVMGTAAYLAPEQLTSGGPVDARADQYALGCVLFEMLTGQTPFGTGTAVEVAARRIGPPVPPSDVAPWVPPAVEAVVLRAMALDPADRYPDAEELAVALDAAAAAVDGVPASGWSTAEAPPVGSGRRPHRATPPPVAPAPAAGPPPHEHGRPAPSPRAPDAYPAPVARPARRRAPVGLTLALVALLVAAGAAGLLATRGGDGGEGQAPAGPTGPPAAPAGQPLALDAGALTSFDPQGNDGRENDDDLALLLDGDPSTTWSTVGYNTADFGRLKDGVGFMVSLPAGSAVAAVGLDGVSPGTWLELRAADGVPADVGATTVVASQAGAGGTVELRPAEPVTAGVLVVWVVAPLPPDGGSFRAAIGELTVLPAG